MGFIVIVQIITLKMYSAAGMVCMVCLQCALDCPIITVNMTFVMSGRMMKCAPLTTLPLEAHQSLLLLHYDTER